MTMPVEDINDVWYIPYFTELKQVGYATGRVPGMPWDFILFPGRTVPDISKDLVVEDEVLSLK
jgi:hypothetical protein